MTKKSAQPRKNTSGRPTGTRRDKVTTTIRVDVATHARLMALSENSGRSIVDLVREAVTSLESRRFMEDLRAYYVELRKNEDEWNDQTAEAQEWATAAIRANWDDDDSASPG